MEDATKASTMDSGRTTTTYINKVIYGTEVLIDLTGDTVVADKLMSGYVAHDKSGAPITGTCDFDVNTQDATATAAELLSGKTAYVRGTKITGTMPNKGAVTGEIDSVDENYTSGIEILGVTGTYSGESITAQSKTAVPSLSTQTIQPDTGYDYLSAVTISPIPYTETENSAGGLTATIG